MRHCSISKSILKSSFAFLLTSIILLGLSVSSNAQATLSVQGIVKKSNGVALEDGEYQITFKLYEVTMPPSNVVLWDETIPDVEVISGIYSVVLGSTLADPLNIPFNTDYELGITIGSQEMLPRIRLTSAPYALSLRGETNQFPSTGQVLADKVKVAQGVIANTGAPIVNDVDGNKGYSFNEDNDSGLFSTQNGEASIYTNGVERIELNANGAIVQGTLGANGVNLFNNGGINYSNSQGSFAGWRLADVDDLASLDGWQQYSPISGEYVGWNSASASSPCHCGPDPYSDKYVGSFLMPTADENVLKKEFNIQGTYSHIKVKFRYYALDSWDGDDYGFAGFANNVNGSVFRVAWYENFKNMTGASGLILSTAAFKQSTQIRNLGNSDTGDHWKDVEITARRDGNFNNFWVFIGAAMNGDNDENYAVGPIEVWVR